MNEIFETWGEVSQAMGYSASHARRLFKSLLEQGSDFPWKLKHWLGPRRRIKMVPEEIEKFKSLLIKRHSPNIP